MDNDLRDFLEQKFNRLDDKIDNYRAESKKDVEAVHTRVNEAFRVISKSSVKVSELGGRFYVIMTVFTGIAAALTEGIKHLWTGGGQ